MSHRYQAPEHTSAVFAPSGEFRAGKDGVITLRDDASDADREAMRRAGCIKLAEEEPVAKAKSKT